MQRKYHFPFVLKLSVAKCLRPKKIECLWIKICRGGPAKLTSWDPEQKPQKLSKQCAWPGVICTSCPLGKALLERRQGSAWGLRLLLPWLQSQALAFPKNLKGLIHNIICVCSCGSSLCQGLLRHSLYPLPISVMPYSIYITVLIITFYAISMNLIEHL